MSEGTYETIGIDWCAPQDGHHTYLVSIEQCNGGVQSIVIGESQSIEEAKTQAAQKLRDLADEVMRSNP